MVKATINRRTTAYVSAAYQVANPNTTGESVTKYYQGGAMRVGGTVYYTLSDQIGSTSITLDASGNKTADMRYKPWGEVRYANGNLQTDRTYTGQRSYSDDFGLMFYNARWYDTSISHFAQADNIDLKSGDVQSLDRLAYVLNNPISRNDPTGHLCGDGQGGEEGGEEAKYCEGRIAAADSSFPVDIYTDPALVENDDPWKVAELAAKNGDYEWATTYEVKAEEQAANSEMTSVGGSTTSQSVLDKMNDPNFQKLVHDPAYDCSEIAQDLNDVAGGQGGILHMTSSDAVGQQPWEVPENSWINVPETDGVETYAYHDVYTDGKAVFDPRLSADPMPLGDYIKLLQRLNTDIKFTFNP